MASLTYHVRALVLKKTKLAESDLICTLMLADGSQLKAGAKGARKKGAAFAGRLELFNEVDLLCVRGRNLDIVKEARLVRGYDMLHTEIVYASCAFCISELLECITQADLSSPRLYALTVAGLKALSRSDEKTAPLLTSAHLLKAISMAGFRPSLSSCIVCGKEVDPGGSLDGMASIRFSFAEGGALCFDCCGSFPTYSLSIAILRWATFLLHATFAEIAAFEFPEGVEIGLLGFCQDWIRAQTDKSLKSIPFLLDLLKS